MVSFIGPRDGCLSTEDGDERVRTPASPPTGEVAAASRARRAGSDGRLPPTGQTEPSKTSGLGEAGRPRAAEPGEIMIAEANKLQKH